MYEIQWTWLPKASGSLRYRQPCRHQHRGCTSVLYAGRAAERLQGAVQDQVVRAAEVLGCGAHTRSLQQLAPLRCIAVRSCVCLAALGERGCHYSLQCAIAIRLEGATSGVACKEE